MVFDPATLEVRCRCDAACSWEMQRFLCGRLVLILVGLVVALQIVHMVLLNRLEAQRNAHHAVIADRDGGPTGQRASAQLRAEVGVMENEIRSSWILDASGQYQVAAMHPRPSPKEVLPDVTLVTQCSPEHLHRVVPLLQQWQGPLSVALFAEPTEVIPTVRRVALLRTCYPGVQRNVTFTLVTPLEAANGGQTTQSRQHVSLGSCSDVQAPPEDAAFQSFDRVYPYPSNLLRNTARRAANTKFVFVVDIDMLPSANLREEFLSLANRSGWLQDSSSHDLTAYVVPAFEGNVTMLNWTELPRASENGQIRPFYAEMCWKCQAHTDYRAWLQEPKHEPLRPLFDVVWKDPWEPFYITRNDAPFYDERFKQFGFNRISQVCEMHVAGYKFSILSSAFVLHHGFKTEKSFHEKKSVDLETNRKLFRLFKVELKGRYRDSPRRCY